MTSPCFFHTLWYNVDVMRRMIILSGLLILAASGSGCAQVTRYTRDRGNDFADCFTFRTGICYGAGARAQVTNYLSSCVGGSYEQCKVGIFGRSPVAARGVWVGPPVPSAACFLALFAGWCAIIDSDHTMPVSSNPGDAEGLICVLGALSSLVAVITDIRGYEKSGLPGAFSILGLNLSEFQAESDEPYGRMVPATPYLREKFFIEVGATAGALGFDVGFNPVEMVDFMLGWALIDITGDDSKHQTTSHRGMSAGELTALLKNDDEAARVSAAEELGRRREKSAVKPLLALLENSSSDVKYAILEALGKIGSTDAVPALINVVHKDMEELARCYAIEALGEIEDERAVVILIEQMKNTKGHIHFYAAEALCKITDKDFGSNYKKWKAWHEKGEPK